MQERTLPRTGAPPLKFQGKLIAESESGRWHAGRECNRWHEIAVYRTQAGKYVLAIGYRTCWQGEVGHDLAVVCGGPAGVAAELRDYDPCAHVGGFPPGAAYAERQQRLLADVAARYADQVSEVLAAGDFAEEVE